jgi:Relaxase/Mobilisation nuclease domain
MAELYPAWRVQRPGYHISLSPEIQDTLSVKDWFSLAADFVQLLKADRHQVIAVLHDDTFYPQSSQPRVHAHFVMNRLCPTGALNLKFHQIERVVRQLEEDYHLTPVPCSWELRHQRFAELKNNSIGLSMNTTDSPITMGNILQQAASLPPPTHTEPLPLASEVQMVGAELQVWGDRLEQNPELSGFTVIGATASLSGSTLQLSSAIWRKIQFARELHDSDRVQNLIEELEAVNQRASRLEERLEQSDPSAGREESNFSSDVASDLIEPDLTSDPWSESEPSAEFSFQPESEAEAEPEDPLLQSLTLTDERLDQLEQTLNIPGKAYEPIALDRQAPIDQQLDQIAALINQFHERLERMENVVFKGQVLTPSVLSVSEPEISQTIEGDRTELGQQIAQELCHYLIARAEFYGTNPEDPVVTTLGVVQMQQDGVAYPTISIEDEQYGIKFEAIQTTDDWEISINDLSNAEIDRLSHLPQTKDDYQMQTNIKHLTQIFQRSTPEEFAAGTGKIRWKDEQGAFNYRFEVTTSDDGIQTVLGREDDTPVFSAQIDQEGRVHPQFSTIPTERIDDLLAQQTQAAEKQHQPSL